jgi:hypothetical protein
MASYKVVGTDGKEYGPITADVLRQWIAQKRVVDTTLVQAEGATDWKPLSAFPEFTDVPGATPPASPPGAPPAPTPVGPTTTSGLAIASLVCGILCVPAIVGVVLGIVALVKINKSKGQLRGQGLAIAGICVSALMMLMVAPTAAILLPALAKAKSKAQQINCVNNLKQIGLAARIYSGDNKETFPPNFLSMSNELNTPRILVCPADSQHTPANSWADFDPRRNVTYEYLKPGIAENQAMGQVIFRCPIHNNVGMGDGSVQMKPRR